MKNKKSIIVILSILIIIILSVILINTKEKEQSEKKQELKTDYKFVKYSIDDIETDFNSESYSIIGFATTKEDYNSTLINYNIKLENPSTKDFDSYNYLLLVIVYDECSETLQEKEISVDGNKATISYDVYRQCGLCAPQYNLYEISLPKAVTSRKDVKIDFNYIDRTNCPTDVAYKPVLYLYPKETTQVTVNFKKEELLTTTYPKFQDEWTITAHPNGDLYDSNNNYYYALYWEELDYTRNSFTEGFYVSKDNAISFLEEKLTILGLNAKEKNEFIMYWLPILENNEHNLVYFESTEDLQKDNKLIIEPQPDTLIRIRMHVKKISEETTIKEQKLTTQTRQGFTAVEWGGTLHN